MSAKCLSRRDVHIIENRNSLQDLTSWDHRVRAIKDLTRGGDKRLASINDPAGFETSGMTK
jgi:hypothetical protein